MNGLHENHLGSTLFQAISKCSALQYLEFKNNSPMKPTIHEDSYQNIDLSKLSNLKCLKIASYYNLKQLNLKNLSQLESITLCDCTTIHQLDVDGCNSLTNIELENCENFDDQSLQDIAEHCSSLKSIGIIRCSEITDQSIFSIVQYCPNLLSFSILDNSNVTDNSITELAEKCESLQKLAIENCEQITDESVDAIATNCNSLESLIIFQEITDNAVITLSQNAENLLNLSTISIHSSKVTDGTMVALVNSFRTITYVDYPMKSGANILDYLDKPQLTPINLHGLGGYSNNLDDKLFGWLIVDRGTYTFKVVTIEDRDENAILSNNNVLVRPRCLRGINGYSHEISNTYFNKRWFESGSVRKQVITIEDGYDSHEGSGIRSFGGVNDCCLESIFPAQFKGVDGYFEGIYGLSFCWRWLYVNDGRFRVLTIES